jgi:hypothetical protein
MRRVFAVTRRTDIPGIKTNFNRIARAHPSRDTQTSFLGWQQMEATMNFMPTKRERLILTDPEHPPIIRPETLWNVVGKGTPWKRIVAASRDPELTAVAMVCAIGLLVTAALLVAFPRFGEITQSVQQFF